MTFVAQRNTSSIEFERARRSLAGGVDSPVRAGVPMGAPPPVIASARGSKLVDVDGREYIDYLCAYGPVLLGHGDPAIREAIAAAAESGTVLGVTHPDETRLAERIRSHLPSMERLRFVSTGTEACMSAARVARSFTRREKIVRFSGDYHGHADEMIFSAGASSNSAPAIEAGVTSATASNVIILPYNDIGAVERCFAESRDIAALFVEPVCANMGLVMPAPGYLEALRMLTSKAGVLLVFDEIITGFRLALGGAQALYGVQPDLTCVGKTLGGGLPIAAFGGREDIMARLAPDGPAFQGGTFSGNPLCVAAAHALLDKLENDRGLHVRLDALGRRLADGARRAIAGAGLDYPVVQIGSIVDFMFRGGAPHANFEQARTADRDAYARYYWKMLDAGIYLAPSPMEVMFLTGAHTERDVDETIDAIVRSLEMNL